MHADDTLRSVASHFARHAITAAPVIARANPGRLVGLITVDHLLDGRLRDLAEVHHRERPREPRHWTPAGQCHDAAGRRRGRGHRTRTGQGPADDRAGRTPPRRHPRPARSHSLIDGRVSAERNWTGRTRCGGE
ncbi:CBS domain-containing protein [Pseudonocardia sp.]|uniref:CBS domain-containing protein n=1 Tax=Pseudonocardia sp. TaxID=60912 RepID=UPI00345682A7